jgi:hypothetical protein
MDGTPLLSSMDRHRQQEVRPRACVQSWLAIFCAHD